MCYAFIFKLIFLCIYIILLVLLIVVSSALDVVFAQVNSIMLEPLSSTLYIYIIYIYRERESIYLWLEHRTVT